MEKMLKSLTKNVIDFCTAFTPYSYVLLVVTCLVVGIMLAIPSDKAHEKAKEYGGWAIIGSILIAGCVTIGKAIGKGWSF